MTSDGARSEDAATVTRSEEEPSKAPAALGDEAASYLVRVTLRRAHTAAGKEPTNESLEGSIEAALLTRYPDFSPSARAERLDK